MKKKILISLLVVLLLVCAVAVGVFADGSAGAEETFRVYKADLTLGTDLRFNIKVQTGALPEGAGDIKLLVWEGAVDGVDYTQATTETAGYTELTAPIENEEGLLVFTYSGINAKEIGKTLYLRAYYKCNGETIYTEAKRYSMAQYLHSIYDSSDNKEKAVIDALMAYGDAAQELGNEGEPLPKISDGVVKITVAGGKFADGFTEGKFLMGEKLNVVADGTESAPMLTAELGEGWLWTMADGKHSYKAEAEYSEGIYVGKYENAFEVTVGENTEIHTDKTLAEVFALANGGTVKLLADVDMGDSYIPLDLEEEITLDLNGKKITSSNAYLFDIFNAELTVKDDAGGGSVTTTSETVFYLNVESSVLTIEGGTFTGATHAVYVAKGTATISGGTFTGDIFADTANGTLSITGGTFSSDPSAYAAIGYVAEATETGYIVRVATEADYVAAVTVGETTTKYMSLAAAFANANGGTVKLLKDVDMGESSICLLNGVNITLDLNGKKITSSSIYIFNICDAELTVKDSVGGSATTTGEHVFFLNVESSVLTIEGGTFTGATYAVYVANGKATINGGTFKSNLHCESGSTLSITGGTFSSDPSEYLAGASENALLGYVAVYDASNENWLVRAATEADYVAEVTVGETTTKYTSLAAAFANANGGTVKLLADVDMGEYNISLGLEEENSVEITLDLNGKKITSSNAYLFDIYNAELTVQDSVGGGSATTTGEHVFYLNNEFSVLTIESGTFTGATYAVYVSYGTATINGGTFTGEKNHAVQVNGGTATITGGTFTGENNAVQVNGGTATITGGTFTGATYAVEVGFGTATITGGTFTSENVEVVCVYGGEVTISGGTFTGDIFADTANGTISVTGGTFSSDPSEYLADGYEVVGESNLTYSVIEQSSGNNEYIPV
ncbi:MAG: hypothetical protein IJW76_07895 [Clostridia bacterium]|nr:hypothetical protein [Clostridia bacterium]